ncbi:hypothetical protein [Endozoicomonas sp. YOMI1]|uniref:hypothetical protein n=1 Tax=Endozoicomonas sp. YOMI1 TaxID=2828739 RepID=UPI0021476DB7|nr:hypothetical protein [Endozoicomonas sp. YOMI1]
MYVSMAMNPGLSIQPELSSVSVSDGGLFKNIRKVFFCYDPLDGTKTKLLPSALGIGISAAGGAFAFDHLAERLQRVPGTVRPGTALADRVIDVVESIVKENPLACGAVAGAATAIVGLYMAYSSLKPIAKESIEAARDELRHQLQRAVQEIEVHQEQIAKYHKRLSELKAHLPAEAAKFERLSQERYAQKMASYMQEADYMAGRLKGFVDGVLMSRSGNRGDAPREYDQRAAYEAGAELSRFVNDRDWDQRYSLYSQMRLLNALQPVLSDQEYDKVNEILWSFPTRPYFSVKRGPIAKEYSETLEQSASEQRQVGVLESQIKTVLGQYPNLKPDAAGNIPKPPVGEFGPYMPE